MAAGPAQTAGDRHLQLTRWAVSDIDLRHGSCTLLARLWSRHARSTGIAGSATCSVAQAGEFRWQSSAIAWPHCFSQDVKETVMLTSNLANRYGRGLAVAGLCRHCSSALCGEFRPTDSPPRSGPGG